MDVCDWERESHSQACFLFCFEAQLRRVGKGIFSLWLEKAELFMSVCAG